MQKTLEVMILSLSALVSMTVAPRMEAMPSIEEERFVDSSAGFVHLCVKDRGVMGEGIFLGEAYLPLKSIEQTDMDVVLQVGRCRQR